MFSDLRRLAQLHDGAYYVPVHITEMFDPVVAGGQASPAANCGGQQYDLLAGDFGCSFGHKGIDKQSYPWCTGDNNCTG